MSTFVYILFVCSDSLSPSDLAMEVLWMLCERTECAAECLYQTPVIETLLAPVIALLNGQQVKHTHTHTYIYIYIYIHQFVLIQL